MRGMLCYNCGSSNGIELHHIVFRSQAKALENCKLNHVYLCAACHRGTKGVHNNRRLDLKLKLEFQNKLEFLFDRQFFTKEQVRNTLGIKENAADSLLKIIVLKNGLYKREDVIRQCLGGKIYE